MTVPITGVSLWMFRLTFTLALCVTAGFVFFFLWGLLDGTVSSFNISLWLTTIAVVTVVPIVGWSLRSSGKPRRAILVLCVLAVPGLLYGLFILLLLVTHPSWN